MTTRRQEPRLGCTKDARQLARSAWPTATGALLLAPLLLACGAATELEASEQDDVAHDDSELGSAQQAIVDGQLPAVKNAQRAATVALGGGAPGAYYYTCSGVLIGSRYLLTAMHCVAGGTPSLVLFGDDARNPTFTRVAVRSASVCGQHICDGVYSDLGIVEFDGGLPPGAVAALLPSANRTLSEGTLLELWGYGGDGSGTDGIKRFGFNTVSGFDTYGQVDVIDNPDSITVTACQGDSGGPGFFTSTGAQAIVAVTHGGANCADFSDHLEVSRHLGWIRGQLEVSTRFTPRPPLFLRR